MAKACLQNTKFSVEILPTDKPFWAKIRIVIENEHVHYNDVNENISVDELEEWIFSVYRLLAGAYKKEFNHSFEKAGLAIDLYPYTKSGREATRQERREEDCVMLVRLLMRESKAGRFLGGVYSLLFHREEMRNFIDALKEEFDFIYCKRIHGIGEYHFVGVSPLGSVGCNYWYLDPFKKAKKEDYVWIRMGRHNKEQIAYVDSVRLCTEETAPYDPRRVKRVLRFATQKEIDELLF